MAKVQGVKEKLHSPLYDAFFIKEEMKDGTTPKKFVDFMTDPRVIRFFVDIQNKTKLETNLQASGVLPSLNTFEARALRVVVSNLRPTEFKTSTGTETKTGTAPRTSFNESAILADLIYNSVTSLIVGEKIMIEMPTFWFPSGAGVSPGLTVSNHGEPDPTATFRFAEPVYIEPQQNFRVEMAFPQGVPGVAAGIVQDDKNKLAHVIGPLRIWVVLDGYLTRDVQ
ncbi:MAG: hypothetical protein JSS38_00625 [Nitrospira sp.]|nr:hypothetical protein [Nitrospira sp.]MBS0153072.1 hypothetical protein [Nitrospira sp.]MBS0167219.1 hypothetical protein [Nitrospira sp.]